MVRDLVWGRATAVVWLDMPLAMVWAQVVWRSVSRAITQQELWNGNRSGSSPGWMPITPSAGPGAPMGGGGPSTWPPWTRLDQLRSRSEVKQWLARFHNPGLLLEGDRATAGRCRGSLFGDGGRSATSSARTGGSLRRGTCAMELAEPAEGLVPYHSVDVALRAQQQHHPVPLLEHPFTCSSSSGFSCCPRLW